MTKHAINAFLATSVAFINELASLCERMGADAREVERGLKSERRIGPLAYLTPGAAFSGGTLARDVAFLQSLGAEVHRRTPVIDGVHASNSEHRSWTRRRVSAELTPLAKRRVAVWGLTYKPGTDTLRRSSAVELCRRLHGRGAAVRAHDPAVRALPADLAQVIDLAPSALAAVEHASALVVATEWPEYQRVDVNDVVRVMDTPCVVDAGRFLAASLGRDARVKYATIGRGTV
jgi:UDPglucose 6-dehydrogenase